MIPTRYCLVLADKGYDADKRVIEPLQAQGKTVVTPLKCNRRNPRDYDLDLYKARYLIENFFAKLKQYRAMPTQLAMINGQPTF
ncbi:MULTISPECIES: transposase [unclassified Nostoc]|uniref:transposase n=1 Tax=unclassified Nostoc TaxID=2593658 RepID=UPI00391AB70C